MWKGLCVQAWMGLLTFQKHLKKASACAFAFCLSILILHTTICYVVENSDIERNPRSIVLCNIRFNELHLTQ